MLVRTFLYEQSSMAAWEDNLLCPCWVVARTGRGVWIIVKSKLRRAFLTARSLVQSKRTSWKNGKNTRENFVHGRMACSVVEYFTNCVVKNKERREIFNGEYLLVVFHRWELLWRCCYDYLKWRTDIDVLITRELDRSNILKYHSRGVVDFKI